MSVQGCEALRVIGDEECALWRLAVAKPPVPGALEVYLDWLLTRDPPRGQVVARHLRRTQYSPSDPKEAGLWRAALGLSAGCCTDMHFNPLPYFLYIEPSFLAELEPVLDRLPFLEIHLDYGCPDEKEAAQMMARPAIAKIRRLHWSAYGDYPSNENYQSIDRRHHGNEVFVALCASPHVAELEELYVTEDYMDSTVCVPALLAANFRNLRRFELRFVLGNEGAIKFAASPVAATLRRLDLCGHGIEDTGAIAIATHLKFLEVLDVRHNKIGPAGEAALRTLPALRELLILPLP